MAHHIYRSAIDGRIVSREYAEANPDTTIRERVEPAPEPASARRTPVGPRGRRTTTADGAEAALEPVSASSGPQAGETWMTRAGCRARILHRFQAEHVRPANMVICALLNPGQLHDERIFFTGASGRIDPMTGHDHAWDLIEPAQE